MAKKIGANEPCWCGSGRKYKKCHQHRETEKAIHPKELDKQYRREFQFEICLHPDAPTNCGNKIIEAHTIQRKGAISKIVDSTNHVYTFYPAEKESNGSLKLHSRGWKKASTFNGFCDTHDTNTFADLETRPFVGDEKQCSLVGYRAASHEVYQKIAVNAANPLLRDNLDVGKSKDSQQYIQETLITFTEGTDAGFKDIQLVKKEYDNALQKDDFSGFNYVVIYFDGDISVVSTGAVIAEYDFNGKLLQKITDLTKRVEGLMFGIVSTPTGGAVVFSWSSKFKLCNEFIESLLAIPEDDIPSVIIEFVFEYVENTYFSKSWWDSLDQTKRDKITALASLPIACGGFRKFSRIKYTNWKITNITKIIK